MLNDRLKEARINAGFTQKEIADAVGIATTTYNGYERGKSDPDAGTLCKMMRFLNVDANFIYQDYNVQKNSPASEDAEEDRISVDEMKVLLRRLGLIGEDDDITEKDAAFVSGIFDLLNAWFSR